MDQFDADIICFQEHKLQRREITSAIANVPGFDGYFTFSKIKKGYSGVQTISMSTYGVRWRSIYVKTSFA